MKIIRKAVICIVLTCVWLVLNETADAQTIAAGIAISILCVWLSGRLLGFDYAETFVLPLFPLLKYAAVFIKEVYVAGVKTSINILRGTASLCIVQVTMDKRIKRPFLQNIVANSVTFTPGSVCLAQENGKLTVLCLTPKDSEAPSKKFENLVIPMEKER